MATSFNILYDVRENQPLRLKIFIEYSQAAISWVRIGNQEIVSNHKDNLEIAIPVDEPLTGKTLTCLTLVTDVNPNTDETGVIYELSGGVVDFKHTSRETRRATGETYTYLATFDFFSLG